MIASRSVSIWTSNEKSHRNVFSEAFSLSICCPLGARGETPAVSTLLTPVSLCFLAWRRPETDDRSEIGERQRIFSPVGEHSVLPCPGLSAVPDTILLHRRFTLRRRGISVPRNSFTRCYRQFLRVVLINRFYRRVRRLGAPFVNSSATATP
mgnify:CR=1 FL=1